jgi:predicted ATPase
MGKTRLAVEVARRVCGRSPTVLGWWSCPLSMIRRLWCRRLPPRSGVAGTRPFSDRIAGRGLQALVAATAATALDVRQAPGMSIADALAERLSLLLLVLDNCEHVLDAVAQLCAAVLSSADDVRILVTSREPLGLPEEARYWLSPLGAP